MAPNPNYRVDRRSAVVVLVVLALVGPERRRRRRRCKWRKQRRSSGRSSAGSAGSDGAGLAGEGGNPCTYFDNAHAPARPRGPCPPVVLGLGVVARRRGRRTCWESSPGGPPRPRGRGRMEVLPRRVVWIVFCREEGGGRPARRCGGEDVPHSQNWHVWTVLAR